MSRAVTVVLAIVVALPPASATRVTWETLPPSIQTEMASTGVDARGFDAWVDAERARTAERVREGDEDHLVFYALQSTRFTALTPIEPAASADALAARLDPDQRRRFLDAGDALPPTIVAEDVRARLAALARALARRTTDPRLLYFQALIRAAAPSGNRPSSDKSSRDAVEAYLARVYVRAMRFLGRQALAARSADAAGAVAALFQTRGLSTDTAVEAGFLVQVAVATFHALDPARRLRRVVVLGPGLDLAPRTGLLEDEPPQSYQPYAVADAVLATNVTDAAGLTVTCLDINPRVVAHLARARRAPTTLTFVSGVAESAQVTLSDDYRDYLARLGGAVGTVSALSPIVDRYGTRTRTRVQVRDEVDQRIEARQFDVVTERADQGADKRADLIVATNVLAYLDDRELALALVNLAAMLAPGGALVHNDARASLSRLASLAGLPAVHARTATLATVRGGAPLFDRVFIHRRP